MKIQEMSLEELRAARATLQLELIKYSPEKLLELIHMLEENIKASREVNRDTEARHALGLDEHQ